MSTLTAAAQQESSFATGVLFVHSCPKALVPHVEWALAREIGKVVKLNWEPQPLMPRMMRTVAHWRGAAGTAAEVASSLFGWQQLRFEITEDQSACGDGGRWMHTPRLGMFRLQVDAAGNGVLTEDAIRGAIEESVGDAAAITRALNAALGEEWDRELEPFRAAEQGDATIFELPRLSAG
jgi:hypothetical protein